MADIAVIQHALADRDLDAWLFYDHHHRDPIAYRVLGLDASAMATRRWFYLVPAEGEPRKLVHRIEAAQLDALPGRARLYSSWRELASGVEEMLRRAPPGGYAVFSQQPATLDRAGGCRHGGAGTRLRHRGGFLG